LKKVLVTGGTGFIGANLVRRLLQEGHEVHLLLRPGYAAWRIEAIKEHLRLHLADLRDQDSLAVAARQIAPDWIFHLAAHGAYSWQADLHQIMETNCLGTINLLEACRQAGFEAFINTGSSSEYGFKDHAPAEDEWLEPNSSYAVSKAAATQFCRFIAQKNHLNVTTLRLYSVYGPYEDANRLFPQLILKGLRGSLPRLVDPETARDYIYVEDAVSAFLLAASQPQAEPGAVYNVGSGKQTSLRQVVACARLTLGIREEPVWGTMPDRQWDTTCWVANPAKIKTEVGWAPRNTLEVGFIKTVQWFRGAGDDPWAKANYGLD
jgi:nucleoside-diphosphate-sugar epimerase